jgi:hypothetical protein
MSNVWLMGDKVMGKVDIMAVLFSLVTSQNVAGSIPEEIFMDIFLPALLCTLGSTHAPKEMSTRNISGA